MIGDWGVGILGMYNIILSVFYTHVFMREIDIILILANKVVFYLSLIITYFFKLITGIVFKQV